MSISVENDVTLLQIHVINILQILPYCGPLFLLFLSFYYGSFYKLLFFKNYVTYPK
jgi:hypothetical protein